jgi:hypothetical protein
MTLAIHGLPTEAGQVNYTVWASNGLDNVSLSGNILVLAPSSVAITEGHINQTVNVCDEIESIPIEGSEGAISVGWDGTLSEGISNIGQHVHATIVGTADDVGTFTYTVWASNGLDNVTMPGSLLVLDHSSLTVTNGDPNKTLIEGNEMKNITIQRGGGSLVMTLMGQLPPGLTSDLPVGVQSRTELMTLSGTPSKLGSFNYTITASNGLDEVILNGTLVIVPAVAPVVKASQSKKTWPTILGISIAVVVVIAVVIMVICAISRRRRAEQKKASIATGILDDTYTSADAPVAAVYREARDSAYSDHPEDVENDMDPSAVNIRPLPRYRQSDFASDLDSVALSARSSGALPHRPPSHSALSYNPSDFASDLGTIAQTARSSGALAHHEAPPSLTFRRSEFASDLDVVALSAP